MLEVRFCKRCKQQKFMSLVIFRGNKLLYSIPTTLLFDMVSVNTTLNLRVGLNNWKNVKRINWNSCINQWCAYYVRKECPLGKHAHGKGTKHYCHLQGFCAAEKLFLFLKCHKYVLCLFRSVLPWMGPALANLRRNGQFWDLLVLGESTSH